MNQEPVAIAPAQASGTNAVSALFKVLMEPRSTFESLKATCPWIVPLALIFLCVLAFTYVNWPYLMDQRIESFQSSQQLEPAQKAKIVGDMEAKRESPGVFDIVIGPVFVLVFSVVGAALWLLLGNVVAGGDGTFKSLWSAFNYAGMVGVLEMALKTLMMHMKQSANVYTSLALLTPDLDTKSYAFRALDAMDVFSIWFFLLMGVALSVMCKVKPKKATTVAVIAFVVWTLGIKAGLGTALGGMFGM